jgi:hypothetical protein
MGAGDQVPGALSQLGCEVTMLGEKDLAAGDLGRFDAIVTGVRAFNTRADLRAAIQRVFDYVSRGGTLLVQYNVLEGGFLGGDAHALDRIGPYPLRIGRDRVTVEEAPVTFVHPAHARCTPTEITARDFDGWRRAAFCLRVDPYQPLSNERSWREALARCHAGGAPRQGPRRHGVPWFRNCRRCPGRTAFCQSAERRNDDRVKPEPAGTQSNRSGSGT